MWKGRPLWGLAFSASRAVMPVVPTRRTGAEAQSIWEPMARLKVFPLHVPRAHAPTTRLIGRSCSLRARQISFSAGFGPEEGHFVGVVVD